MIQSNIVQCSTVHAMNAHVKQARTENRITTRNNNLFIFICICFPFKYEIYHTCVLTRVRATNIETTHINQRTTNNGQNKQTATDQCE